MRTAFDQALENHALAPRRVRRVSPKEQTKRLDALWQRLMDPDGFDREGPRRHRGSDGLAWTNLTILTFLTAVLECLYVIQDLAT